MITNLVRVRFVATLIANFHLRAKKQLEYGLNVHIRIMTMRSK